MITPLLLAALLQTAAPAPQPPRPPAADPAELTAPGVSEALARWRGARVRDVRYDLALDVTARDSAVGRVTVRWTRAGTDDAILDFRGRALGAVTVNGVAAGSAAAHDGAHLRIPARLLRPGSNVVEAAFVADIRAAGASILRYTDPSDGNDYLYTLLVPSDANQLFPCFDQPDLKARVRLRLTTPVGWTAVANGAAGLATVAGAWKTTAFAETKPISTYLIAFAAGPWTRLDAPRGARPMSLYVRRSRAGEVDADSLFALNGRALAWLERWFGVPYPFGKYDFVLAPAFPFGGMEHPGAVFYSEERFIFRERPTLPQQVGRAATVYHEVAHMWFGDYVTMRWFDDLWLKEGFATYMAAKLQAAVDPRTEPWLGFWLRNKPLAYGVDATAGTTPVWQALGNLDQAKSNYGPIVYNKAPGILKQLDHTLGERAFQRGVQLFLQRHAYGNAGWQELLAALGDAAALPLDDWGRQYILRPGLAVLEPAVTSSASGNRLTLLQRPARPALSGDDPWPMRLTIALGRADGSATTLPVTLDGPGTTVPLPAGPPPAFVFANAEDQGYALALLDARSRDWLTQGGLGRVKDGFLRAMLWGALWDEVREARLPPSAWVATVLRDLPRERDEQVVAGVLGRLTRATTRYLGDAERARLQPAVEAFLRMHADDAARPYGLRKPFLDALVDVARTPGALASLDARLDADSAAGEPLRAPTRWAIVTRLVAAGAPPAEARLAAETARDTTSDGARRVFVAGAARPDARVKADYFDRYLRDEALNEDWATASLGAFNAAGQDSLTAAYLVPALDALPYIQQHRRIFFLGAWLDAFVGGRVTPDAQAAVAAWLEAHPELGADLRRKVLQAADELERTVRIRERWVDAATEVAP